QRDIDAMRHRSFGKDRKDFLGTVLPVAAMDEHQRRRVAGYPEEIDPVAVARGIAKLAIARVPLAQFARPLFPARDHLGAAGHRDAIVEAEVALLLAHLAPVHVGKGRHYQALPAISLQFPLCRKMVYSTTQSIKKRHGENYGG